jgi:hypothetical protein
VDTRYEHHATIAPFYLSTPAFRQICGTPRKSPKPSKVHGLGARYAPTLFFGAKNYEVWHLSRRHENTNPLFHMNKLRILSGMKNRHRICGTPHIFLKSADAK